MGPKIKICGIKTIEEARMVSKYPIDYIGFIFADSKRQVTVEDVKKLREHVREDIKVVGVFVNEELDTIKEIAYQCELDVIQLHGNEDDDYCIRVELPVWKSIAIRDEESVKKIHDYQNVDGVLLDTYHKGQSGGTGKVFQWDLVKDISSKQYLILAGGLTPNNIVQARDTVTPQVLDVNSGVETNLLKDEDKIKRLMKALGKI